VKTESDECCRTRQASRNGRALCGLRGSLKVFGGGVQSVLGDSGAHIYREISR
jgi:hypothetical protein